MLSTPSILSITLCWLASGRLSLLSIFFGVFVSWHICLCQGSLRNTPEDDAETFIILYGSHQATDLSLKAIGILETLILGRNWISHRVVKPIYTSLFFLHYDRS